MFFSELATKDNAVYNQFVDMFSVLSADTALDEDAFKRIIKFLSGFIEKVCLNVMHLFGILSFLNNWRLSLKIKALTPSRTNTPSNLPTSWLHVCREWRMSGSGLMLRSR
jgi:hypothetical protein